MKRREDRKARQAAHVAARFARRRGRKARARASSAVAFLESRLVHVSNGERVLRLNALREALVRSRGSEARVAAYLIPTDASEAREASAEPMVSDCLTVVDKALAEGPVSFATEADRIAWLKRARRKASKLSRHVASLYPDPDAVAPGAARERIAVHPDDRKDRTRWAGGRTPDGFAATPVVELRGAPEFADAPRVDPIPGRAGHASRDCAALASDLSADVAPLCVLGRRSGKNSFPGAAKGGHRGSQRAGWDELPNVSHGDEGSMRATRSTLPDATEGQRASAAYLAEVRKASAAKRAKARKILQARNSIRQGTAGTSVPRKAKASVTTLAKARRVSEGTYRRSAPYVVGLASRIVSRSI